MSKSNQSVTQTQSKEVASVLEGISTADAAEKQSINYTVRTKLLVAMILIAIIPLGLFFYIDKLFLEIFISDLTAPSLTAASTQTATDVEFFIDEKLEQVRRAGEWTEVTQYLGNDSPTPEITAQAQEALQRLQEQDETEQASFALLNSKGENILDLDEANIGNDESERLYFTETFKTETSFVSPVLFDATGEPFIYFSMLVKNVFGETLGVLRVEYPLSVLQALMAQPDSLAGQGFASVLLDENGLILANTVELDKIFQSIAPLSGDEMAQLYAAQRLPNQTVDTWNNFENLAESLAEADLANAAFAVENNKGDWQAAYKNINAQPWRVILFQPQDTFAALATERTFTMGVIVLVLALITFVVALNVSRLLAAPLIRLTNVAQQVAGGAFGLHVPVETHDEIGLVAYCFNRVTHQMRELTDNIDQIITERTNALGNIVRSLETSTTIGRQITTILDTDELLRQVVNRIQVEFNFYYTHMYLVDQETGDLVMVQGSGEVGRRLKARGHRLNAGEGIVGTVASSNEFFLSNDVSKVLNYVANTELPETRSELALPLRKGDRVLGVLDIQARQVDRFTSADVSLMQSIANQTAVAIDNARLLAETKTALKEVERLNRRLTREGWDQFEDDIEAPGYRFTQGVITPLAPEADMWLPMQKEVDPKQLVKKINGDNGDQSAQLAIPLILRGEVIGMLGVKRDETTNWADEEVAAVEAVANQVSLALENARLSKEQEKTIFQLKEVDRLKDEFLTSMSHELRTPLNSIIGFADVILQGIDGEVNDVALNDVSLIHNSGKHLLSLINDVLDLAKIEAGKMELVREDLNIETIVDDVIGNTASLVMSKPVTVVKEVVDELPLIYADETRFKQVLINMVSNASKFTEEGQITIEVKRSEDDPDNFAYISVIDSGIGIPANMLETVFDRFGQVESVKTRKVGGTGLGLPICKQLVELHGGTIGVSSEEDVGSIFYFTVPFVGAELAEDTSEIIEKLLDATKRL